MADIDLVIKIPENTYRRIQALARDDYFEHDICGNSMRRIANGTPLPKGHGKIVDIGKIDNDRIERDNPIIYLTVNGEYIEAVSLDYLNGLPAIIEADKEQTDE